ncbi:HAD domain-containing protein [Nocardia tengchongensis]|uniref:HAD domain-containing protein n=1 Tax=Nocardia tengchongensis TaxID=2055889 RepID=UPI003616930B
MTRSDRPLLFLDVDGPLIPFGDSRLDGLASPPSPACGGTNPLAGRIDPVLGPLLLGLRCELVWATTWMQEANSYLSPILGLPVLPVMEWPKDDDEHIDSWFGLHWKTRALVARAAGRAFIWVDDEICDGDKEWVADNHAGPALLYRVDHQVGLRSSDFDVIGEWAAANAVR